VSHFDVFGLSPSVDLDVGALEEKYRALALQSHPDRAAGADAATRRKLAETTATLNEALKVLRDPVRRAFYLLKLRGVDLENETAAARQRMPPEFLEEVMNRREALDEARQSKDVSRAQEMGEEVRGLLDAALAKAKAALSKPAGDAAALAEATVELGRVRYFTRYLEEVEAIEEDALQ
jgi:molecular chaperone HscB